MYIITIVNIITFLRLRCKHVLKPVGFLAECMMSILVVAAQIESSGRPLEGSTRSQFKLT